MRQVNINTFVDDSVQIKRDYKTQEVVVVKNNKDIFRRHATQQNISLAFSIYMGAKYIEVADNDN